MFEQVVNRETSEQKFKIVYDGDQMSIKILQKKSGQKFTNSLNNEQINRQTKKMVDIKEVLNGFKQTKQKITVKSTIKIIYLQDKAIMKITHDAGQPFGQLNFTFQALKEQNDLSDIDKELLKGKVSHLQNLLLGQKTQINKLNLAINQLLRQRQTVSKQAQGQKTYIIRNCYDNKVLDVNYWKYDAQAITWQLHNGFNQQFYIHQSKKDVYKIQSRFSRQFLTGLQHNILRFLNEIKQAKQANRQQFKIIESQIRPGTYGIQNVRTNLALELDKNQNFTNVILSQFAPNRFSQGWFIFQANSNWKSN